jgi:hypothetical protein
MLGFAFGPIAGLDENVNVNGVIDVDWMYDAGKANGAADQIVRKNLRLPRSARAGRIFGMRQAEIDAVGTVVAFALLGVGFVGKGPLESTTSATIRKPEVGSRCIRLRRCHDAAPRRNSLSLHRIVNERDESIVGITLLRATGQFRDRPEGGCA